MEDNKEKIWWRPAMLFFGKTTGWIISPLIIIFLIKNFFVLNNIIFYLLFVLGFFVTCFGIYKEIKKYKKDIHQE